MKVCHLTSVHRASDPRIFLKECSSLFIHGFEVYLLAINARNETKNGVHILGVQYNKTGRFARMFYAVNKLYRKAIEIDADVYHLHDPELLRIALKLKRKGKKVIFDSHEDVPQQILGKTWLPLFVRKFVSFIYQCYEAFVLKRIDSVVSVTPLLTNRLTTINKNTYQITNYPICKDVNDIRKWNNSIVFSGGIFEQWMHDSVIKAIEDIDVTYTLAGRTDLKYLTYLRSLKGWCKVDYKGLVPFEQVSALQQEATIGIALNDYVANVGYKMGTIGNTKLFEYMMAGIPVIATDFTLWKQIVDKYRCGICVNPHDITSIKNAIIYLLTHKNEAKEMGDRGKKAVLEEYNWSTQEKILLDMYNSLLL